MRPRARQRAGRGGAVAALVAALAVPVGGRFVTQLGTHTPPARPPALPVLFEPSPAGDGAGYLARGTGLAVALGPTEASFRVGAAGGATPPASASVRLEGADPGATLVPSNPQPARSNYFLGNDPAKWRTEVPTYARVTATGAYPGIDIAWYGAGQGALEYDVVVAPGADPRPVALSVGGAERLEFDAEGDLVATLAGGHTLRQHRPVAYQPDGGGGRTPVEAAFRLEDGTVRFALGPYDHQRQLVIDPVLAWSTYLGGSDFDLGQALALDVTGNLFVAGRTESADFPTSEGTIHHVPIAPRTDTFVTKFDPFGTILYSAVVGGASIDTGVSVSVSPSGVVHVVGLTLSPDFPTANPQDTCPPVEDTRDGYDAFAFKLNPSGSALKYSTCLGGPRNDWARGSALDAQGNLYVVGRTASKKFPVRNNTTMGAGGKCLDHAGDPTVVDLGDAFVTKLGPKGVIQYSTCWGGVGPEEAFGVDVDADGFAYVVGDTRSASFPQKKNTGVQTGLSSTDGDGFVLKVSPVPSPRFSTYLGANDVTQVRDVAVRDGKLYLAGAVAGDDFATRWPEATAGVYQPTYAGGFEFERGRGDAFLARLRFEPGAPHAPVMDRITYLGGSARDNAWNLALAADAVWVTSDTDSTDFPQVGALQACHLGNNNLARFDLELSTLSFSSCFGGSNGGNEEATGLAVDIAGNAYVAGFTGSADFPTTEGAYDRTCGTDGACDGNSRTDAFVAKFGSG